MANADSDKRVNLSIPIEEGEPFGATPNDKLVITKVQAGTLAEGKIQSDKRVNLSIPIEEGEPFGATPNDKLVITKVQAGTLAEGKIQSDKRVNLSIPIEEGEPFGATPNDKLVITKVQAGTLAEGKIQSDKRVNLSIPIEEGEPFGATPNDKLVITKVQAGTLAEGKIQSDKRVNLSIPIEEGEPFGATPNDKLVITKVQAGTLAEGKIQSDKRVNLSIPIEEGEPFGATPNDKLVITKVQAGTLAEGKIQSDKRVNLSIPIEEGEPFGATPNDKLVITKVQAGTLAEGKIQVGDQIVSVNGRKIQDASSFYNTLRFAPPCANIVVIRDEKKIKELAASMNIPPEREKLINRRSGYNYFVAKIVYVKGGPKLGLGIKHYQNRVLVSRCNPKSLVAQSLQIGDHLIDIDGVPVTDKDVARELLIRNIQASGQITTVVERAETAEAKHWVQKALEVHKAQPSSVQMGSDVRAIAARERAKLKEPKQAKTSILKAGSAGKVTFVNDVNRHIIASDNEGRALKAVKK